MTRLHSLTTDIEPPERFTYPFCYEPHPLAVLAAEAVQRELASMQLSEGKMFGVLVVMSPSHSVSFLAAYSGLLEGRNDWPYFVPPVFDAQQPDGHFKQTEREISAMDPVQHPLLRKQMSQELQLWLFHQYRFLNARGETRDLVDVWQDYHCSPRIRKKFPLPPGGTGDCCAPKLLQYAYSHGLKPLCMAEFWWGPSPKTDIRHHGQFYPACRGKCKPVLTWMLQGLDVDPNPEEAGFLRLVPEIVFEDESMVVLNKPSGMLSIPGRTEDYSVATWAQERWPGAMLVHRLDLWTSGLIVVAKTKEAHLPLQEQFVRHTVRKRYIAVLDGVPVPPPTGTLKQPVPPPIGALKQPVPPPTGGVRGGQNDCAPPALTPSDSPCMGRMLIGESPCMGRMLIGGSPCRGRIELPLFSDPMNRPRQIVDYQRGKTAVTEYEVLAVTPSDSPCMGWMGYTLVALYPHTGRTHQLRVHCAHEDGLGCPIHGDELYGRAPQTQGSVVQERLCLHADRLELTHPVTNERLHFELPYPFEQIFPIFSSVKK